MIGSRLIARLPHASSRRAVYHVRRDVQAVALTFDDGPGEATGDILDTLAGRGAHATFFIVGNQVPAREHLLRRVVAEGHGIGNHTMTHPRFGVDRVSVRSELQDLSQLVLSTTGARPRFFRPPFGILDREALSAARRLRMRTFLWDVDPQDWRGLRADEISDAVLAAVRPGSIILLHDGGGSRRATAEALPQILDGLSDRGHPVVTLSELSSRANAQRPLGTPFWRWSGHADESVFSA